jgi:hypothetical protein
MEETLWTKKPAYTVAGKAIGFALEQPLHVVTLACPASGILKQLENISTMTLSLMSFMSFVPIML